MRSWSPKLTEKAAAASLGLAVCCAPAFAQDTSSLQHATLTEAAISVRAAQSDTSSSERESSLPQPLCGATLIAIQLALILAAPIVLPNSPAFARNSPDPQEEERSEKERPISYGVEIKFSSGHADRGLVINDRPVVQPVTWVSRGAATLSVWSSFALAETTDGSRPQILDLELTRAHEWRNLTIEPAVRIFFYHDPLSIYSSSSIEGWLYLSYPLGAFRLFTNHSVDVLTYRSAYFGEAGIASERRVSPRIEVGGSFGAGWASSTFNESYVGIDKSALNRMSVEGWLTAYVTQHLYIGPRFEFSTIVDRAVRAEVIRPTYFFFGLTTGVEF
jgi:hypothetical protein